MKKGDRIQTAKSYKGEIRHGVALSISGGKVTMLGDDGSTTLRAPLAAFAPSPLPFPPSLRSTLKRGDRVKWVDEETKEERLGVVEKASLPFLTVVMDGGESTIKAVAGVFSPSDKPLPTDGVPTPMDAYEVKGYRKTAGHDDSQPFVGAVHRDGRKILDASNDGWGGCNRYRGDMADVRRMHDDAKAWAAAFGHGDTIEPEDLWLDWYANYRPYGGLAADYLRPLGKGRGGE